MSETPPPQQIRNFALIAHIDHGKSTLADRLIEQTGGLPARAMKAQLLDSMELERERGITIKAQTVRLSYTAKNGKDYLFNLMDTPGHADFTYEVSRSLAACEGALLLVDASQGMEAQSLANYWAAVDAELEVIPVINKIDLPAAEPEAAAKEVEEKSALLAKDAIFVSAKTGAGIADLLEAIVEQLPPPSMGKTEPLQALVVDSWYDAYLGVVILVRVKNGTLKQGEKIRLLATGAEYQVEELGVFTPERKPVASLAAGEIGYIHAGLKHIAHARVGDTISHASKPAAPLPGFAPVNPPVFAALFPNQAAEAQNLREGLEKLALNDASLDFTPVHSPALGPGFRCGFLGLLHMEIIMERLRREAGMEVLMTAPGVAYQALLRDGTTMWVRHPGEMPNPSQIAEMREPFVAAAILTPEEYIGRILTLCEERRGVQRNLSLGQGRAVIEYDLPLAEVVYDFHDKLKSASGGYASFDSRPADMRAAPVVKVSILVNGEEVDALALLVHRARAETMGRSLCLALREAIPKHLFKIPLQAAVGGKIIARETIPALRKDVTAKCYGGDISRKRKLLDKQKKGKKKMRQFGQVEIPQDAFMAILRRDA